MLRGIFRFVSIFFDTPEWEVKGEAPQSTSKYRTKGIRFVYLVSCSAFLSAGGISIAVTRVVM